MKSESLRMKFKHQNSRTENKIFLVRPKVSQDPSLCVRQCQFVLYRTLRTPISELILYICRASLSYLPHAEIFPKISVPLLHPNFSFLLLLVIVYVISCHRNCLYLPNPCAQHRVWVHVQTGGASAWMLEMRNFFCCQERPGDIIFESLFKLPARSVDLSALNLTELVNGMLNRGNHFFFFSKHNPGSFSFLPHLTFHDLGKTHLISAYLNSLMFWVEDVCPTLTLDEI